MPKVPNILYEDEITAEFNSRYILIEKATPEQLEKGIENNRRICSIDTQICVKMGHAREYLEEALREASY